MIKGCTEILVHFSVHLQGPKPKSDISPARIGHDFRCQMGSKRVPKRAIGNQRMAKGAKQLRKSDQKVSKIWSKGAPNFSIYLCPFPSNTSELLGTPTTFVSWFLFNLYEKSKVYITISSISIKINENTWFSIEIDCSSFSPNLERHLILQSVPLARPPHSSYPSTSYSFPCSPSKKSYKITPAKKRAKWETTPHVRTII